MTEKIAKLVQIFLYVLMGVSAIIIVLFYTEVASADVIMYWAYILLVLTLAIAVIAPIIYYIMNPGKAKTVLTGIVIFVILFLIGYFIASGNVDGDIYQKFAITEGTSQFIGGLLITTYIIGGLAILAIIYASVAKFFK
jgi:hypothetical protein